MKKVSEFHVVVIDDKKKSCRRISERLSGMRIPISSDLDIVVSVSTIHVNVERTNRADLPELDQWTFSSGTLDQILCAANNKADLLIVDYIYVDNNVAKYFRKKAIDSEVLEDEIEGRALNPKNLADWVLTSDKISASELKRVTKNLFHSDATVYLHTYTPQGLYVATGSIEQRYRMAALAFPQSNIHVIDTRSELFNEEEFDWPREDSKYDADYYPYQLAILFAQIVQKEVAKSQLAIKPRSRRVFVVHGRATEARESVARFLEKLALETVILDEQTNLGRSVLKKFREYSDVGFAVILLTGDDRGGLASEDVSNLRPRARQNVVFELGYFLAKLGDERVCCLCSEGLEVPSDYSGVLYIPLDALGAWKPRLARELKDVGFDVDLNNLY